MFNVECVGNLHIHSLHSDGAAGVPDLAKIAAGAGLDFICINDHDYMMTDLHLEEEGIYDKVLVMVGLEIGRRDHHYLAFGLKEMVQGDGLGPQECIDRVNALGGFGFLAHPFEKGMPFREKSRAFTWKDLNVGGFQGISIWNFASRWKEGIKTVAHGLGHLAFRGQVLKGPSTKTLAFWDRLCQVRRVSAIGGSDAHGSEYTYGPITIIPLSYGFLLGTINVHIFLKNRIPRYHGTGKEPVLEALREGRLYIAHDGLCPARGFRFDFVTGDGFNLIMGEESPFQKGKIVIEVPREGEIRLIRNGGLCRTWHGRDAVFDVREKGVYRVEVYRRLTLFGWRPWIFSNPIYLR